MLELDVTVRDNVRQFTDTRFFKVTPDTSAEVVVKAVTEFVLAARKAANEKALPANVVTL